MRPVIAAVVQACARSMEALLLPSQRESIAVEAPASAAAGLRDPAEDADVASVASADDMEAVDVGEDVGEDMVDIVGKELTRAVRREARSLDELMLVSSTSPNVAWTKVAEFYLPPRVMAMLSRIPNMALASGPMFGRLVS